MSILKRIRKSLRRGSSTISSTMNLSFTLLKCFSSSSLETSAGDSSRQHHAAASTNGDCPAGLDNILQNIVPSFSFHELEVATDGFSSSNKIGEGGFGSVYEGRLGDEKMVAIKVLAANSKQGHNEFMSEVASLSKVSHENLVRLLGVCIDGPCRILVYDYMENNSLAHILLGGEETRAKLCWKARREISLGIAQGLAYVHEEVKPNIVHRDIKASNILLDRNSVPKLSDFGLCKLFPENVTHISTEVAGTLGYLAPEYAMSGRLTREVDVYGFGVLLLEITRGRKAIDFDIELGEHCLAEKAWKFHRASRLLQLVDPVLNGKFRGEAAPLFMKVALLCVQEKSELRPSMSMALKMMRGQANINSMKTTHPGLITDIMNVKISPRHRSHI